MDAVPFEKVEINGREYFREIPVENPDIQLCAVGSLGGDGIPDADENADNNLWKEWVRE